MELDSWVISERQLYGLGTGLSPSLSVLRKRESTVRHSSAMIELSAQVLTRDIRESRSMREGSTLRPIDLLEQFLMIQRQVAVTSPGLLAQRQAHPAAPESCPALLAQHLLPHHCRTPLSFSATSHDRRPLSRLSLLATAAAFGLVYCRR